MSGVFISYRRDDSAGHAGRLYDRLSARFGADEVFLDTGAIPAGDDFVEAIERAVSSCDVVVAVIGRRWSSATDEDGRRRIDLEDDFVRLEMQTALEKQLPVIPLLVGGARPLLAAELPGGIERLARVEALEITDQRFDTDVQRLIEAIDRIRRTARTAEGHPEAASEPAEPSAGVGPTELVRKVVTIVAVGRTDDRGGGDADPEKAHAEAEARTRSLGEVAARFGGTVDASNSDVAVFGVPRLHEDDAERAIRVAEAFRDVIGSLESGAADPPGSGETRPPCIGIATGEVVIEERPSGFACTGSPMRSAPLLSARGEPGDIVLDEQTFLLARSFVVCEPVTSASADAAGDDSVWRLVGVRVERPNARSSGRFVGRGQELELLEQAFERTARDGTCHLFTVIGGPGVGKTRLVTEFAARVGDRATRLTGHCLAYGDGITYWPVTEIIREAAEIPPTNSREEAFSGVDDVLEGASDRELIRPRLLQVLGLADTRSAPEETFWAIRRFLEHLAARRPLIVIVEDIHWAEPTLLDLLDYLADWSTAPVLLVCLARHELLDHRPGWAGGKRNASTIAIEPLTEAESDALIDQLLGAANVSAEVRNHIEGAAEGNPLFVEEMIAMLIDEGSLVPGAGGWTFARELGEVTVPPTMSALLAARVDQLDEDERQVVQRASVIGREFFRGAVQELSPPVLRSRVAIELLQLIRREFIHPVLGSSFDGEEVFHFRHILIRDAAYRTLPKRLRAELHRRFADWVERRAGDRSSEFDEIVGYHLEQAFRYVDELKPGGDGSADLAERAGATLIRAGKRAIQRGDLPAAVNLLSRAVNLLPQDDPRALNILPDLGEALFESGHLRRSEEVLNQAIAGAASLGDARLEAYATVVRLPMLLLTEPTGWVEEARRAAAEALPLFERTNDHAAMAKTWSLLQEVHVFDGRFADAEVASRSAADHASLAGQNREHAFHMAMYAATSVYGPTPVEEGLRRCEEALAVAAPWPSVEPTVWLGMCGLRAMQGDFDQARELIENARNRWAELGLRFTTASAVAQHAGFVEMLADDWAAAERELRTGLESLEEMGEQAVLASVAAMLARVVWEQERFEEAERLTRISEEAAAPEDLDAGVQWMRVRGLLRTKEGQEEEGVGLLRRALELAERTDDLDLQAGAQLDLGRASFWLGAVEQGADHVSAAIALYERKGNRVAVERARQAIDSPPRSLP